jgi:transposase
MAVIEDGDELLIGIETIRQVAGCPSCRVIARTKDRLRVIIRDLPAFNRRVRLVWSKSRFTCPDPDWLSPADLDRALRRAPRSSRAVRAVASLARWPGVSWATVIAALRDYGTPLVEDPRN